jgi:hypothetical protein
VEDLAEIPDSVRMSKIEELRKKKIAEIKELNEQK